MQTTSKTIIPVLQTINISSTTPQVQLINLSNDKYFQSTLGAINSAKSSIYLSMYFISLSNTTGNSKVLQLVNSLIDAKKRGVEVKVILDRTCSYTDSSSQSDSRENDTRNKVAYDYLKQNGIEINYDDIQNYTHSKCLIIDEETVIFGSTNWTTSALTKNNETNALIISKSLAQEFLKNFNSISLDTSSLDKGTSPLVFSFAISQMPTFEKFIENHDETLFSIYLYIISKSSPSSEGVDGEARRGSSFNTIDLDYSDLKELFLKNSTANDSKQNYYIRRWLTRLSDTYNLIQYLNPKDTQSNPKILLKNSPSLEGVDGEARRGSFSVPQTFWLYNWHTRLDAESIFCYFINRIETGGVEYKTWSKSIDTIYKDYKLRKEFISKGMINLRYWNLIQTQYSRVENSNYSTRTPNTYRLLPIYSMGDFENSLKQLETKYSKAQVSRAITYAKLVYCDHDLYEIENIIQLELDHGEPAVQKAFDLVSTYDSKTDSKHSMKYIVGVLNNKKDQ
jgi:cardiolipin synthase